MHWELKPGSIRGVVMPTDVVRLWDELVRDYVSDLRLDMQPIIGPDARAYLRVSVRSQRYNDQHPRGYEHIWASQDFPTAGYSISPSRLFDLLIVAKQQIIVAFTDYDDPQPKPTKR